jgi:hypothetical protein
MAAVLVLDIYYMYRGIAQQTIRFINCLRERKVQIDF